MPVIEEIDAGARAPDEVLREALVACGNDPLALVESVLRYVARRTYLLEKDPDTRRRVHDLVDAAFAPPAPAAPQVLREEKKGAASGEAKAEASGEAKQAEASGSEGKKAEAPGSEGKEEGSGEEESEPGIKPNAGNGADMGRYSWVQTLQDVTVSVPVPPGTRSSGVVVSITNKRLKVAVKGADPVLDGEIHEPVQADDCMWSIVDGRSIEVTLQKAK